MTTTGVTASTGVKLSSSRLKIDTPTVSAGLGRGLAVTQAVQAGSSLVRLDPLISVLGDALLDKACSTCFVSSKNVDPAYGKELLKCTGCRFLHYCSKVAFPRKTLVDIRRVSGRIGRFIIRGSASTFNSMQIHRQCCYEE